MLDFFGSISVLFCIVFLLTFHYKYLVIFIKNKPTLKGENRHWESFMSM